MEPTKKLSAVGVIVLEGAVLLLRRTPHDRSFPGMWCLPGGKVDEGEDSLEAVVREVEEETGFRPPMVLWDTLIRDTPAMDTQGRLYDIDAYILDWAHWKPSEVPSPTLSDEHDEWSWCGAQYILDHPEVYPTGPATRIILERVVEVLTPEYQAQVKEFLDAMDLAPEGE